jgi:ABC-2 type transport system permease protein
VPRHTIFLAKFLVATLWSAALGLLSFCSGLLMRALIGLPGSLESILHGSGLVLLTLFLTLFTLPPFSFFASAGRGYLLPIGVAILALMLANLTAVIG